MSWFLKSINPKNWLGGAAAPSTTTTTSVRQVDSPPPMELHAEAFHGKEIHLRKFNAEKFAPDFAGWRLGDVRTCKLIFKDEQLAVVLRLQHAGAQRPVALTLSLDKRVVSSSEPDAEGASPPPPGATRLISIHGKVMEAAVVPALPATDEERAAACLYAVDGHDDVFLMMSPEDGTYGFVIVDPTVARVPSAPPYEAAAVAASGTRAYATRTREQVEKDIHALRQEMEASRYPNGAQACAWAKRLLGIMRDMEFDATLNPRDGNFLSALLSYGDYPFPSTQMSYALQLLVDHPNKSDNNHGCRASKGVEEALAIVEGRFAYETRMSS